MTHCIAAREVMQLFILKSQPQSSFPPADAGWNCPQEACDKLPSLVMWNVVPVHQHPETWGTALYLLPYPLWDVQGTFQFSSPGVLTKQHGKNSGGMNSVWMNCTHSLFAHTVWIVSVPDSLKDLCKSCNTQTHPLKQSLRCAIALFCSVRLCRMHLLQSCLLHWDLNLLL